MLRPGDDHRHPRRRPARPHAGARRRAARLALPHLLPRPATAPPSRSRRAAPSPPTTTRPRSPPSPRRSTSSPTSSRTCRPRPPRSSPHDVRVLPGARALAVAQDRLAEKSFIARARHPVAALRAGRRRGRRWSAALAAIGRPAILKTRRFGYDGKGQARDPRRRRPGAAFDAHRARSRSILEAFVPFEREISVVARARPRRRRSPPTTSARTSTATTSSPPPRVPARRSGRDAHARGRSDRRQRSPTRSTMSACSRSRCSSSRRTARALLVNEIAPRVHNSGHWTLDGCRHSQFEQHIRADLPAGRSATPRRARRRR